MALYLFARQDHLSTAETRRDDTHRFTFLCHMLLFFRQRRLREMIPLAHIRRLAYAASLLRRASARLRCPLPFSPLLPPMPSRSKRDIRARQARRRAQGRQELGRAILPEGMLSQV